MILGMCHILSVGSRLFSENDHFHVELVTLGMYRVSETFSSFILFSENDHFHCELGTLNVFDIATFR